MSEGVKLSELIGQGVGDPNLGRLNDEQLRGLFSQVIELQGVDRQENQLLYYRPVSPIARDIHRCQTRYVGVGGGNGGGKSEVFLAELAMLTTGIISEQLDEDTVAALKRKFRGPRNVRVVVESLTTTLSPIILPKLQWWKWNGLSEPGGDKGHWGWIPRRALKKGQWVSAWSEKHRILTVLCFNPDNPQEVIGESTWQFMAHNQDASDFASGDFHDVFHDELTTYPIWRENEARTMRMNGRMLTAMTWPDDPAIPVDWMYDLMYEKGRPGPNKDPDVTWMEIYSEDNPNLHLDSIARQKAMWDEQTAAVRLYGKPIRFSNRIHPLFTDTDSQWCLNCGKPSFGTGTCSACGEELIDYNHVQEFEPIPNAPTIFLLDPHPRKPHMGLWVQVDSWDDCWAVAEMVESGGPEEVRDHCRAVEEELGLRVVQRLGDPKMLKQPSGAVRGVSWRDEFDDVGLRLDYADNADVGRSRVNDYLKIDPDRRAPRLHFHPRCTTCIHQMARFVWGEYKHSVDKDVKQSPKEKDDDFPALLRYLMNAEPSFGGLSSGVAVLRTR